MGGNVDQAGNVDRAGWVRAAFARGISSESAAVFLDARDAGLGWEQATSAAAAGIAERYGSPAPVAPTATGQTHQLAVFILGTLVLYTLLRPLLGFGHELTVAALAASLHHGVSTGAWEPALGMLGLDPLYIGAAIRSAGGVHVTGFAAAAPLGCVLHSILPSVFLTCEQVAGGAGVSMVALPGAPVVGRALASFGADVAWLAVGLWLFWRWRIRDRRVALLGLLIQAHIAVNHLLDARVVFGGLDASALARAVQPAFSDAGWFTVHFATWPEPVRGMLFGLTLLAVGYACAALLLVIPSGVLRWLRPATRANPQPPHERVSVLLGVAVAFVTAFLPIGDIAVGNTNWDSGTPATLLVPPRDTRSTRPQRLPLVPSGPTPVRMVQQSDGSWQYVVNGVAETIRGVGYNPWYSHLSPGRRARLYDRDFSAMHRLGINTIDGWFENEFDSVTLDAAARNGVGVLMPFELNQDLDYTDPAVRANILERLSAYVEQYRSHPAVRMWAPGNENLHRILFAHWVSQLDDPAARARAQAMAAFLPVVVDRIHQLDPQHPIIYRDADDAYLSWISSGFAQAGGERPWLVYGTNVYTPQQMQNVISAWPAQWPGHALLVSEFAPGRLSPSERPQGFDQLWRVIRSRPDVVLGGLAYTWATNGPEDLDLVFGMVDPYGVPTDGALAALSYAYLSDGRARGETPGDL